MKGVYIIAEIGMAHDGSLGIAHSFIDALAGTGVNAVKFQVHIAAAESSLMEPFRTEFSYEDQTRSEYWKRTEFTTEQWAGLKAHCEARNLDFIASPFSIAAAGLLRTIGVKRIKIASGEVNNHLLISHIAKFAEFVFVSSGMSDWQELDDAAYILQQNDTQFCVLQCTTAYPTEASQWGLNVLGELRARYTAPIGFSDHSGDIFAALAAVALGASAIEFHVTFDKEMFGPDAKSSLNMAQVRQLVTGIRQIECALAHPVDKADTAQVKHIKTIFGKSLAVNKNLLQGHQLMLEGLETKKPFGQGIDVRAYEQIPGQCLNRAMSEGEFLSIYDLNPCGR